MFAVEYGLNQPSDPYEAIENFERPTPAKLQDDVKTTDLSLAVRKGRIVDLDDVQDPFNSKNKKAKKFAGSETEASQNVDLPNIKLLTPMRASSKVRKCGSANQEGPSTTTPRKLSNNTIPGNALVNAVKASHDTTAHLTSPIGVTFDCEPSESKALAPPTAPLPLSNIYAEFPGSSMLARAITNDKDDTHHGLHHCLFRALGLKKVYYY